MRSNDDFFNELKDRMAYFKPQNRIYKELRQLLKPLGHWKEKPRGKPWPSGKDNPNAKM